MSSILIFFLKLVLMDIMSAPLVCASDSLNVVMDQMTALMKVMKYFVVGTSKYLFALKVHELCVDIFELKTQ